ncbi:MAG: FKBP-type peptidyl-prolyl cis-trans isomerase [Brevundimonas sp.]|uniref:FKBP-type peptidyl-prolyl cis-trans isomerase n=1 Tax=Brevundimonas sp. TaxID=1871086 RepID=UPI0025BAFC67|nr:FKBP-type peptidyl-prolyl cis-trans isomerase [Brevundimonas sp.]MBX3478064.1 FKBP-type peptidyl-prolyl cis-trans isomerase [Brevundimonas sp.]
MRFAWVSGVAAALLLSACGGQGTGPSLEAAQKEADFYMAANARKEGVHTLPSGLQYEVVQSGPAGGASPDSNDLVRVDYEGKLTDGTIFDSSFSRGAPAVFSPDGVVPGWTEALQRMKVGDEWVLYVPPALGYGERGGPPRIPPNAVLIFRLRLLAVAPTPGGDRHGAVAMG